MSKHTPGPWRATADCYSEVVIDVSGEEIAILVGGDASPNARLIAAAPELLEALRDLVDAMTGRLDGETTALHNALIVLAKAEGERK